ncbi:hypothetical protein KKC88_00810 [Patescibacteria group bacterium]|nr:hypothetical protein [Patescibacteria group bacterium]MBU1672825.1 hypothetical protein [Patescibacteria group bacterium]MBU1963464.1 hypothetical protein [Patescibacteria group bacterium]
MRLSNKQILNLPVYTQSEDFLGRVIGFEVDAANHQIVQYHVGSSSSMKNILTNTPDFLISENQVIEVNEEKMIVEDLVIKELEEDPEKVKSGQTAATSINSERS